jgi:hypothetical protein
MIVTVEVIRDGALDILSDMERLDLIRINASVNNNVHGEGKLSGKFAGSLCLSDARYEAYQNALREGRYEWTMDT